MLCVVDCQSSFSSLRSAAASARSANPLVAVGVSGSLSAAALMRSAASRSIGVLISAVLSIEVTGDARDDRSPWVSVSCRRPRRAQPALRISVARKARRRAWNGRGRCCGPPQKDHSTGGETAGVRPPPRHHQPQHSDHPTRNRVDCGTGDAVSRGNRGSRRRVLCAPFPPGHSSVPRRVTAAGAHSFRWSRPGVTRSPPRCAGQPAAGTRSTHPPTVEFR